MGRVVSAVIAIVLTVAVAPAAATTSTPQTVESLVSQSTVSAYGQLVAWSRYDPAAQAYRLVVADVGNLAAPPQVVPIAPRRIAFDVDLGPDAAGRTVAVYSRCTTEPDGDYYGQKLWPNNAAGCDVYEYDFAARREHKLTASSPVADDFLPTIWKGAVAFARAYGPYHGGQWRNPVLYTHSTTGTEPSRRQSIGPTHPRIGLTGLDLYGSRLAFTRTFDGPYDGGSTEVRVTTLGATSRLLEGRASGLTQRILRSPQFHAGRVRWTEQCAADTSGCTAANYRFWSSLIKSNAFTFSPAPRWVASAAFILDTVWFVAAAPGFSYDNIDACQVGDPPDPARSHCDLRRAVVTFAR